MGGHLPREGHGVLLFSLPLPCLPAASLTPPPASSLALLALLQLPVGRPEGHAAGGGLNKQPRGEC